MEFEKGKYYRPKDLVAYIKEYPFYKGVTNLGIFQYCGVEQSISYSQYKGKYGMWYLEEETDLDLFEEVEAPLEYDPFYQSGVGRNKYIVCAANRVGDLILCGARHFDHVMHSQIEKLESRKGTVAAEQGFIDQFGDFHNRADALKIAVVNGQNINWKRNGSDVKLFSEGLY